MSLCCTGKLCFPPYCLICRTPGTEPKSIEEEFCVFPPFPSSFSFLYLELFIPISVNTFLLSRTWCPTKLPFLAFLFSM